MITIEITGAIDAAGTLKTFYIADEPFTTSPTDTPAHTSFDPTVTDSGTIGVSVFGDGMLGGATALDVGEILLSNANGQYDSWLNYGFDGRPVVIRSGTKGAPYPAGFTTVFSGTVSTIAADRKSLSIRLRDKQWIFTKPVLTVVYAGTNSLPNGVEGVATDIKGRVKPRVYGTVKNISPPLVNTSLLIYQVSDIAINSIDGVYDKGAALTLDTTVGTGGDVANATLLQSATVGASKYATCKALGLVRLGSSPAGAVTMDVTQGATAAARSAAQILRQLALAAGVTNGELDTAAITALDAANSAVVGLYIDDDTPYLDHMDNVARSVGAWYGFTPAGLFTMARWEPPSGTSVVTIGEYYASKDTERRPLKDIYVPAWAVSVMYGKNYTVQTSDIAGAVTIAQRNYIAQEFRSEVVFDNSIQTQFLLALSLDFNTYIVGQSDANTEATRLLNMHKVLRNAYDVPVPLDLLVANPAIKLGACATLQISRFGLSGGKLLRIQSVRLELAKNRATLTLWG